jgi:hypothetical protein
MNPYATLPPRAFWKTGLSEQDPFAVENLYRKKFDITPSDRVMTAGSCFAQHIARRMRSSGYSVLDVEPGPPGLTDERAAKYGYGIYSARYGNVYTARQLRQLMQEAIEPRDACDFIWQKDGAFFDAQRPAVEPFGLPSAADVIAHRKSHIGKVRALIEQASILIFTLGLTETWEHKSTGTVFPTAPGVVAGVFDAAEYGFKNLSYEETKADVIAVRAMLRNLNPALRIILTVSPVPLTATASGEHVLAATVYSKSVLRAVAGSLAAEYADIDYFPSYEIITGPQTRGALYRGNLRDVAASGVDTVMKAFFAQHPPMSQAATTAKAEPVDVVCEEAMLEAFAR